MKKTPRENHPSAGFTMLEVMIAASFLMMTSLSLALSYSSTGLASRQSDRSVTVQSSLESTMETLGDVNYSQLLSWNGISMNRGDHVITVGTNQVGLGLILVELVVTDQNSGALIGRLATFRSG
jgi:Tfp pilus assembly protein PilV